MFEHSTGGKIPFDTIAKDGYRGGLEHMEAGIRAIDEASFTPENIETVRENL